MLDESDHAPVRIEGSGLCLQCGEIVKPTAEKDGIRHIRYWCCEKCADEWSQDNEAAHC